MGRKAERREELKAKRAEQQARKRIALVDAIPDKKTIPLVDFDPGKIPQIDPAFAPFQAKEIRTKAAMEAFLVAEKRPKVAPNASIYKIPLTWCVTRADCIGAWSWGDRRAWTDDEFAADISTPMKHLQQSGWKGVLNQRAGKHRRHHEQEVSSITAEARTRWAEIGLEQFDTAFRFRMTGARRLWGVVVDAHFFTIWWDRLHQIYPVERAS